MPCVLTLVKFSQVITMRNRRYSELRCLETFDERFDYLRLGGSVGRSTFGFDRHLNQVFYTSREWRDIRQHVVIRDNGCDLGVEGYDIHTGLLVHHMNPMSADDILHREDWILDPEYLIATTHNTHNAIHYGTEGYDPNRVPMRTRGDTTLW